MRFMEIALDIFFYVAEGKVLCRLENANEYRFRAMAVSIHGHAHRRLEISIAVLST